MNQTKNTSSMRQTMPITPSMKLMIEDTNQQLAQLDGKTEHKLKGYRESLRHIRQEIRLTEISLTKSYEKIKEEQILEDEPKSYKHIVLYFVLALAVIAEIVLAFTFFQIMDLPVLLTYTLSIGITAMLVICSKYIAGHFIE